MVQFEDMEITEKIEGMAKLYNDIAQGAERLVNDSYALAEKKVVFPIDMELIAAYLGIDIQKKELNLKGTSNLSKKLTITTSTKDKGIRIVVDNTVSYKTQRFAIANGIGRYLLNQSNGLYKNTYAIPLIPQNLEEIAADTIAVFIMMPVSMFKDEFLQYLNKCDKTPVDVDDWMGHLSDTCQITLFNLAIGYQQMKQVLCYQRQEEFERVDFDITRMSEDKYGKIYA